jgi:hypothetical protein
MDYLNNVRHEAIRHFRNTKEEDKINELPRNDKIKNIGDLYRRIPTELLLSVIECT